MANIKGFPRYCGRCATKELVISKRRMPSNWGKVEIRSYGFEGIAVTTYVNSVLCGHCKHLLMAFLGEEE